MASRRQSDPIAIRQWVATLALLLEAEEASTRGSSVDRAVALITAATASEAALGLCSSRVAEPPSGEGFGTYLARAKAVAHLNARLVRELHAVQKLRNNVVHNGAEATADDVARAIASARELLDDYVPSVLKRTKALGYGSGICDAVASLVPDHPVAGHLKAAGASLAKRDARDALEHGARAFNQARIHTKPRLPAGGRRGPRSVAIATSIGTTRTDYGFSELDKSITALERWVVPLALGLSPAEYEWLDETLPQTIAGGDRVVWGNGQDGANLSMARRTVEQVALLVLRLVLADRLRPPSRPGDRGW
jgi:hypothetical protein